MQETRPETRPETGAKVAFLGLGVMGAPMAAHLEARGHCVTVYNRTTAKAAAWAAVHLGGFAPTPRDAAAGCDFVMACVGNDDDLRSVCLGPDGAFAGMTAGAVFVDHTTVSAKVSRDLAAVAKEAGIGYVDAPVSGGQAGAENGVLSVMCGGSEADYALAAPVMAAYGKTVKRLGEVGMGQTAKMCNQICIAGLVQGLSEALLLAEKSGLDGAALVDVIAGGALVGSAALLIAGALVFVAIAGLMIAAVCGYMAGLIGASNSPVSGIGILAVIGSSLMLVGLFGQHPGADTTRALIAYALIVTGIVFGVATISNDNLQDLKTGQLVGATPWKQQVALVIGVVFGSLIIPPVLNVLNSGMGFVGVPGAGPNALAAPQAGLISALAKGVLSGDANWRMLGYGALAGVVLIALDEALGRLKLLRLPPLGVALGIYLPMAVILPTVLGSVIGWFYDRWARTTANPEVAERMGTLTATGLIVGESLWGVGFAGIVYLTNSDAPLALVGEGFATPALVGGTILFLGIVAALYRYTRRQVVNLPPVVR